MDEVRLWKTVRSQDEIIKHMRWASGLENHPKLVAYWKFNDPDSDNGQFRCGCVRGLMLVCVLRVRQLLWMRVWSFVCVLV